MSSTVEKAIQVASQKYSAEEWSSLQPTLRTEAIYQVLRRLDAERLAAARPRPDTPRRRKRKRRMAPA